MSKSSPTRRRNLEAALKRFKKTDHITLEDLALLWGVVKARFINVRGEIADFPEPIGKQGNAHLYPARPAIEALIRYDKRHDGVLASRSSKVRAILGETAHDQDETLPPSELLSLARTGAEVDKRKREQGLLVKFSDVQEVAGEVFGEISATLSKLSDVVDPNGRLPGNVRSLVDAGGKDVLLRIYNRLTDMLVPDAHRDAPPAKTTRSRPDRARRTPVRKKPARGVRQRT